MTQSENEGEDLQPPPMAPSVDNLTAAGRCRLPSEDETDTGRNTTDYFPTPFFFDEDIEDTGFPAEISDNTDSVTNSPYQVLHKFLAKYGHETNFLIKFTIAEIMLMVTTLHLVHNFTLAAVCDIFKMLNLLCGINIFPQDGYKFRTLMNPMEGMKIHLTCDFCGHYLGIKEVKDRVKNCTNCGAENIVSGYQYNNTFVTLDLATQFAELLDDPSCKFNFNRARDESVISDIESGSLYGRKIPSNINTGCKYITCTFNSDGSPISNDGRTTITPIYLLINELECKTRARNLVLAGLWYGKTKPRMDIFLMPFVEQMNELRNKGFTIVNRLGEKILYKVLCLCCCVDTIARGPMQGIKMPNGYYCCSWCQVKGEYVDDTNVKYPYTDPEPLSRTERNFRVCYEQFSNGNTDNTESHTLGVTSVSPLINLDSFSMIWGFCPDFMHLIPLGIVRRMLELWLSNPGEEYYIGTPTQIEIFDSLISKIKAPNLIKKDPVLLSMRRVMKSKELENWFLYYSVPVLKGFLPRKYFNHYKLLVEGVHILLQDEVTPDEINQSELLLLEYVYKTQEYYGKYEMTYNMHQLLHLAESVRRLGALWCHTSYPFESAIGTLKIIIKSTRGVPHQIVRNIEVNRASTIIATNCDISDPVVEICKTIQDYRRIRKERSEQLIGPLQAFKENIDNLPNNISFIEYAKVVKDCVVYSKHNVNDPFKKENCYVELKHGEFGLIRNIVCMVEEPKTTYVVIRKLLCEDEPNLSRMKRILAESAIFACKLDDVKCVAVHIYIDRLNNYICSVPLKHNLMNM